PSRTVDALFFFTTTMYGGGYVPDPVFAQMGMGGGGVPAAAVMPTVLATGETVMIMPTIPMGIDIPHGLEYLYTIGSAHVQ
ncbi:hypothetical protein PFISCL1PPCAC_18133, partial [Pristionchus fissidentatus]